MRGGSVGLSALVVAWGSLHPFPLPCFKLAALVVVVVAALCLRVVVLLKANFWDKFFLTRVVVKPSPLVECFYD